MKGRKENVLFWVESCTNYRINENEVNFKDIDGQYSKTPATVGFAAT